MEADKNVRPDDLRFFLYLCVLRLTRLDSRVHSIYYSRNNTHHIMCELFNINAMGNFNN